MTTDMTIKERLAIKRVHMSERDAGERSRTFVEVNQGLSLEDAIREAQRCLQCKTRPCVAGCPVSVSIPEFIAKLADNDLVAAARILRGDNALPAVCGRVCPQETQCEEKCVCGIKGDPVAIGYLERFVADWAMEHPDQLEQELLPQPTGKRVAVVGSGPAGLTCAGDLRKLGYEVTIFGAVHSPRGGLVYGIPRFRPPQTLAAQARVDRG